MLAPRIRDAHFFRRSTDRGDRLVINQRRLFIFSWAIHHRRMKLSVKNDRKEWKGKERENELSNGGRESKICQAHPANDTSR